MSTMTASLFGKRVAKKQVVGDNDDDNDDDDSKEGQKGVKKCVMG